MPDLTSRGVPATIPRRAVHDLLAAVGFDPQDVHRVILDRDGIHAHIYRLDSAGPSLPPGASPLPPEAWCPQMYDVFIRYTDDR